MTIRERLEFAVSATTAQARGEFDRLKASISGINLDSLKQSFAGGLGIGVGAAAGAAGFTALVAIAEKFGDQLIKGAHAAEEEARSVFLLTSAIKNNTTATDSQIRQNEDFISSLSRQVAIADDQLRPALAGLVRVTGDVASAQQLLQLATDASAGSGKDLGTVTDAFSKALEGNVKSIRALFPEITGLVRAGASANEIFDALGQTYRGNAKALADISPFQRLQVELQEAQEKIGLALLPAIKVLADVVSEDLGPALQDAVPLFQAVGEAARLATAPVRLFGSTVKFVADKIPHLGIGRDTLDEAIQRAGNAAGSAAPKFDVTARSLASLSVAANQTASDMGSLGDSIFGNAAAAASFHDAVANAANSTTTAGKSALDYERAARGVSSAQRSLAAAQDELNDALLNRDLVKLGSDIDRITEAEIRERDATRSVIDAKRGLADAQERLNDLRNGGAEASRLEAQAAFLQAQRDAAEAASSGDVVAQTRAKAALLRAEQALRESRDSSVQDKISRAEEDVAKAQDAVTSAQIDAKKSRDELNQVIKAGTEGSKELEEANKRVADAEQKADDAAFGLREAYARLSDGTGKVKGATDQATLAMFAIERAGSAWLKQLKDNNATPSEYAAAVLEISAALDNVGRGVSPENRKLIEDYNRQLLDLATNYAHLADLQAASGIVRTPFGAVTHPGVGQGLSNEGSVRQSITVQIDKKVILQAVVDAARDAGGAPILIKPGG